VQITDSSGQPIDDRDRAAALIGAEIQVEREALPKLAPGEFYWIDLIGAKVESVDGAALGIVSDVTSNGAQDVLVLKDGEVERLIPFVMQHIVREVDVDGGRIVCDWQADW
jgi:16S rRNA processing protein RimM